MDDGEYFVAAQSLRDGEGYRLPSRPGTPPELKYPPGLSLIAAQILPRGPTTLQSDFRAVRLIAVLAGLVYAVTSFATLRLLKVSGIVAASCLVPAMFNETCLTQSLTLLSDVPFAACCTSAALVWAMLRSGKIAAALWLAPMLGIVAGAAITLRSNGVALFFACIALAWVAPKRLRFLAGYLLTASLLPVLARLATQTTASTAPSEPYSVNWIAYSSVEAGAEVLLGNALSYFCAVPNLFVPVLSTNVFARHPILTLAIRILVWLVIIRGTWPLARLGLQRVDAAPALFAALTLAICLIWPWPLYLRILIPFMPFLIALAIAGLRVGNEPRFPLAAIGILGTLAATAVQFTITVRALRNPPAALDEAFEFIRASTEADAVLVTQLPETTFVYTGRQAVKALSDADHVSKNFGNWSSIDAWARVAAGRPFYLLGPPVVQRATDPLAQHISALAFSASHHLDELYRSPLGELAVFRITGVR